MSRKSSTCGVVGMVFGVGLFLLCGGVLGVGALVGMNSPRPTATEAKTPPTAPATPIRPTEPQPPVKQADDAPAVQTDGKTEHVSGYFNRNGKYVQPYNRRPK